MANRRTTACVAALIAALALVGCGREGDGVQSQRPPQRSPEDVAYRKALDANHEERKGLMTAYSQAQESGDEAKIAAAAEALRENRRKSSELVRDHMNLSSSKEQKK